MHMLGLQEAYSLAVGFFEVMYKVLNVLMEFSNAVGYLIVKYGVLFIKGFISISETALVVANILYEDGLIFLTDIGNQVAVLASAITHLFQTLFSIIWNMWNSLKYVSTSTYELVILTCNFFGTHTSRAIELICSIPGALKQIMVLLGNGVWLALKVLPLAVVYVSSMTVFLIGRSFEELSSMMCETFKGILRTLSKIIMFASDIPTESLLGLVVGVCTICLCVKYRYYLASNGVVFFGYFHGQIGQALHNVWMSLENIILNLVASPNRPLPRHEHIGDVPLLDISESETDESTLSEASTADINIEGHFSPEPSSAISKRKLRLKLVEEQENKLCVVCQDRGKSIIIFPCRHVCLCAVCSDIIKNRQGTCPVCREQVRRTMKVYL